ncbi:hypothetical protein BASA81_003768 [Batrachochytrium salamandrivorans]|nr:hypothetical protein BASA81_003768 [Batrachochytrium salamandrivorans]
MVGRSLVEPRGNAYLIDRRTCADDFINTKQGLGKLMVALGGVELVNDKVFCYLSSKDLCLLSMVSTCLWTLIEADDNLWRDLALGELAPAEVDRRMLALKAQHESGRRRNQWKMIATGNYVVHPTLQFGRLFCDSLQRVRQCAESEIKPEWISRTNVTRVNMKDLSKEEFIARFESKRLPVVITTDGQWFANGIARWRHGLEAGMKTLDHVISKPFRAGPGTLSGLAFAKYSSLFSEETPLYIFDSEFGEKFPQLASDYQVPNYFVGEGRDLFELFPGTTKDNIRPDYRWIIAGPAKSGSKWHVDPNCTHAWNVSLLGRKKWILLPPGQAPPVGVFPSPDGGSVAQPVSLTEWFLECYRETKIQRGKDMIEFIADVGDLVFVPSGWWHCVLNLDESFAITQNYVAKTNLGRALRFFDDKPDQISGLRRCGAGDFSTDRRSTFCAEFKALLPSDYLITTKKGEQIEGGGGFSWASLTAEKKNSSTFKFTF